ncbi:THAP domain-containing protein 1-like isoform X2 [Aricia agestis]|uniref:THAP domain-containing protein 1-like isoform X2 n=1 Tax=Aricia agestis TaxID=91739 RepID=UPI001C208D9C|nr:THAP domain-containing protein 1-like isoform X2 [Aricia agestis]XP_041989216.1 THAP domain-containing protein 1-like isoform X2 [Aricia agestis]
MVGCSILGCKSRSEQQIPGLTFYAFPTEPNARSVWVAATGRSNWQPKGSSKVCSIHFEDGSFTTSKRRKYLKPGTIPEKQIHKLVSTKPQSCLEVKKCDLERELRDVQLKLERQTKISATRLKKLRASRESRRRLQKKVAVLENILVELKAKMPIKCELHQQLES